ncbi:type II toxin-antitoxin system VapC family toxin [Tropicimonas sp. TH_r6]|uniref:type II toxin-antitoxin system VapC family toxin n=1 Tax=Tropicimonas sp. TH_r6 TaxID=3082085 RepID=UPI00295595DF|nr:type II toxin-antitoxin system VapC family toxin [Tropicimonas sp. TH_r6]MDV7142998.1 type II toxin-antitoxin system VapC family toxin [Tropicimonas sp. TH_r6]
MELTTVLLDTHTWVWSLFKSSELSDTARGIMEQARTVYVAPCSLHEITAKHRSGKWPEVGEIVMRLPQLLRAQGGVAAPFTAEMAALSGGMAWSHKDPFDRMIAATAMELACPLISKESAFDGLTGYPGWVGRIWKTMPAEKSSSDT